MAISTPQLYLVHVRDQKEAWDTLHNNFKCATLANKLFLKKQYIRTDIPHVDASALEAHESDNLAKVVLHF